MRTKKYYREIDFFRALAVIAVILNHINKSWLPGGFLGVDLFFVISGFVVSASLENHDSSNYLKFVKEFYARRFKRLWPSLAFCILLFSILTLFFFGEPTVYLKTGFYSLLGISNFFLLNTSSDYFSVNAESNPFTHTWSLGVEEQFYFLFPALYLTFKRLRDPALGFILLGLISLFSFCVLSSQNSMSAFYLMPLRFWQFVIGVIAFKYDFTPGFKTNSKFLAFLLLGLLSLLIFTSSFNFISALLISFLMGLIVLQIKNAGEELRFFNINPMLEIGKRSYSLYLYHWPLVVLFKEIGWSESFLHAFLLLSLIAISSTASYNLVETYFRSKRFKLAHHLIFTGLLLCIFFIKERRDFLSEKLFIGEAQKSYSVYKDNALRPKLQKCFSLENEDSPVDSFDFLSHKIEECFLISGQSKTIFAFGNSHAEEKLESLVTFANNHKYNLSFVGKGGLRLFPYNVEYTHGPSYSKKTIDSYLENIIIKARKGDIVLFASPLYHFQSYTTFYNEQGLPISDNQAFKIFLVQLQEITKKLQTHGIKFYFLGSYPLLRSDIVPSNCFRIAGHSPQKCTYPHLIDKKMSEDIRSMDSHLKNSLNNAYISLYDAIENEIKISEAPWKYYHNHQHLNNEATRLIVPLLEKSIL